MSTEVCKHSFPRLGGQCIYCKKTYRELNLQLDNCNMDDEAFITRILEIANDETSVLRAAELVGEHITAEVMTFIMR